MDNSAHNIVITVYVQWGRLEPISYSQFAFVLRWEVAPPVETRIRLLNVTKAANHMRSILEHDTWAALLNF